MSYCRQLALDGGNRAAAILGTEVMDNATHTMRDCALVNIRLPLKIGEGDGMVRDGNKIEVVQWLAARSAEEWETYFAVVLYRQQGWWRLSAQVYLEVADAEWGARVLKGLCARIRSGEWLETK